MINKHFLLVLSMICALVLSSCTQGGMPPDDDEESSIPSPDVEPSVIILRYTGTDGAESHLGALKFKEVLEDLSGGSLAVEIYSESAMGSAGDVAYALRYGTVTMHIGEPLFPLLHCLSWPALSGDITSLEQLTQDGPIADLLHGESLQNGVQFLGLVSSEYYVVNSASPLRDISDFQDLVLASANAAETRDFWAGTGASTVLCPPSQVFTAFQEGMVNAQEDTLSIALISQLPGHVSQVLLTNHWIETRVMYVSNAFYNTLTAEEQQMVQDAVWQVQEYLSQYISRASTNLLSRLEENGIVYQPPSPALQQALDEAAYEPLVTSLRRRYGDELIDLLLASLEQ